MKKVSIIIPFLNEAENIPDLVRVLDSHFSAVKQFETELVFVNDGSTDNSINILRSLRPVVSCKLISFSKNFGSHAALRAGIQHATGDYITFMYADLQDPVTLPELLFEKMGNEGGREVVWATRKSTANGVTESTFSKLYSVLMKRYVSPAYPSKGFDIVMFTDKVAKILNAHVESNSSIFLQILTLGFSQDTIYYDKLPRNKGKSKWTLGKKVKLVIDSFISFSYAPIRFVTLAGIFMFLAGFLFSMYLIIRKLTSNDLVSGWTMLITILMLGFGVTNISLGIIAEYLWRTLDHARRRPVFIVDSVEILNNYGKQNQ